MNHIYRIVWNHATSCYQAVNESVKGNSKSSKSVKKPSQNNSLKMRDVALIFSSLISINSVASTTLFDFTSGLSGWITNGEVSLSTNTVTNSYLNGTTSSLTPAVGQSMLVITTPIGAKLSTSFNINAANSVLGLSSNKISDLYGTTNSITNLAVAAKVVRLSPGAYSFGWSYSSQDYQPFDDGVFYSVTGNGLDNITSLSRTGKNLVDINGPSANTVVVVGTHGLTPWLNTTFTIPILGNYIVGFGAYNWLDFYLQPTLFVSNFTGSSVGSVQLASSNMHTKFGFYNSSNLGLKLNLAFQGEILKVDAPNTYAQNFTINNQGGTIDGNGKAATFSGVFSDSTTGVPGTLTITDSATGGAVTLTGVNTYTGTTTIAGGTLALAGSGSIAASSGVNLSAAGAKFDVSGVSSKATTIQDLSGVAGTTVNTGATVLTVGTANSTTFAGEFTGSGGLNKVGSGTLALAVANTAYTGATTIAGGTLALAGSGSIAASFGVNLSAAGAKFDVSGVTSKATTIQDLSGVAGTTVNTGATVLTVGTANSTTFAGEITGSGGLNKVGSGTLKITGSSAAFTGKNTVNGGHLKVNGYLGGSSLDVSSGSLLSGSGTVGGQTTIRSGGTISPGNSIGTLSVAGGFTQEGGSNYEVEVDPLNTASDRIAVSGSANLASGAQLHVSRTSGQNYVLETKYTVLTASGGVNGKYTLSGDTAVSAFYNLQDQYDANNVYLKVAQTTPFQTAGETRNQIATGTGLQSTPNGSKLHNLIGSMQDFATARGAFDQMSGEIYASMAGARMSDASEVRQAATNRMRSAFCADQVTAVPAVASADAATAQACQANPEKAVRWAQVLGTRATTNGDGSAASLDNNGAGLVVGADMKVGDATRAGIFFNAKNSTYSVNDRRSSAKQQDVGVGIYASGKALESANMDYRVGGTYTQHDVTASRRVNFKGLDESLKANFKANTMQIFGEIGSRVALSSDFMIEPFANFAFVRNDQNAFDEQPTAESTALSALHSVKKSQDMAFTTIGVRAAADYAVGKAKLSVRGMVGLRTVIGKNVPLSTHQFSLSDEFTVAGVPVAKNLLVTEVGVGYDINDQVSMGVSYTGQYASGSRNQGLKATLEIKF